MKKLVSLVLACLLLLSLFAGCGQTETTEPTSTPSSTEPERTPSSDSAEASHTTDRKDSWLCDEKTTLKVLTYDRVNNTYEIPSNDLPFWAWLEDYTNVQIEWEIVPLSGYDEVISTRLASGAELADIVNVTSLTTAKNAGLNGTFVDLSTLWDTHFTNTEAYYSSIGIDYKTALQNEDGSLYSICSTNETQCGHIMLMYNTKWLKAVNMDAPETLDEFTALMKAWKEAGDLNGNGNADEVLFTSTGTTHPVDIIGSAFGVEQYEGRDAVYADEDGVVHAEYTADYMKECLAYLNGLYEDGILDAEINTMNADLLSEKIASDRVGCFIYYNAFSINWGALTSDGLNDPYGEHYTLGPALTSDYSSNTGYYMYRSFIGGDATGICSASDKIDLAANWLDTLMADPTVSEVRLYGFEGQDWHWNEDHTERVRDTNEVDLKAMGCGQITLPFYQTATDWGSLYETSPWYMEQDTDIIQNHPWRMPSVPYVGSLTETEQEMLDMVGTDVNSYWKEMRDKFIIGEADLDKDWNAYVENLTALGLETYEAVYQSVYDRTK